jgi:hypothetical protein
VRIEGVLPWSRTSFCRALGATPFKGSSASQAVRHQCCVFSCEFDLTIVVAAALRAEMLHNFPSMKNSGGRRRRSAHPDRTGCLHPPRKRRLKLGTRSCSIEQYAEQLTCNHPRMARGKSGSPVNVRFGKRLGALRKDRGWTYTYLSEHSGVATTFLHGLEHGTKEPCLNTIDILAKSFELSISELMRGV